jgi:hypothetical protein
MMKIDDYFPLPQIIFDETLAINYEQFQILNELNMIEKICYGIICCHFRFSNGKLIYPKLNYRQENNFNNSQLSSKIMNFFESKSDCIYCFSNKKSKKNVTFFCNFRNSQDNITNDILEYCENNAVSLFIFDIENLNSFYKCLNMNENNKKFENLLSLYSENSQRENDKLIFIDDQLVDIDDFVHIFSNLNIKCSLYNCFICNRKIISEKQINFVNNPQKPFFQKCEICKKTKKEVIIASLNQTNQNLKLDIKIINNLKMKINSQNKKINTYSFINKLKINEFYSENPGRSFFEKDEKSLEYTISSSHTQNDLNFNEDKENFN